MEDPGSKGKKLSKSNDDEKLEQRNRLANKYFDAQITWIQTGTEESWDKYKKISEEFKRQYDW